MVINLQYFLCLLFTYFSIHIFFLVIIVNCILLNYAPKYISVHSFVDSSLVHLFSRRKTKKLLFLCIFFSCCFYKIVNIKRIRNVTLVPQCLLPSRSRGPKYRETIGYVFSCFHYTLIILWNLSRAKQIHYGTKKYTKKKILHGRRISSIQNCYKKNVTIIRRNIYKKC